MHQCWIDQEFLQYQETKDLARDVKEIPAMIGDIGVSENTTDQEGFYRQKKQPDWRYTCNQNIALIKLKLNAKNTKE